MRRRRNILIYISIFGWLVGIVYFAKILLGYFLFKGRWQKRSELNSGEFIVDLGSFNEQAYLNLGGLGQQHEGVGIQDFVKPGRQLPDTRPQKCNDVTYATQRVMLVSIIIAFHNEDNSALLRAVYSVLQRSPPEYLLEIILIDDFSTNVLTGQLLSQIPLVKVYRNEQREGLVRSRNKGAELAGGNILCFIDCHCEVNVGWMEPLLHRIRQSPYSVVSPVLDTMHSETLIYQEAGSVLKGGFDWDLHFKWEETEVDSKTTTISSPVLSGSVIMLQKDWFSRLGRFDSGLDIWGGENLELSLKAWMCGGFVEIVPCSRVGHMFRTKRQYKYPDGNENIYVRNVRRVAEIWLDEYKRFFYFTKPSARMIPFGSIAEQKSLKNQLKCKGFRWYMDYVYPELRLPDTDETAYGKIEQSDQCIDIEAGHVPAMAKLIPCVLEKDSQNWTWKKSGEVISSGMCLTAHPEETHSYVLVQFCNKEPAQKWQKSSGQIVHQLSGMCLDSRKAQMGLIIVDCVDKAEFQRWTIKLSAR